MTSSQLSKIKQLREIDRSQPHLLEPVRSGLRYHLRYQWRPVNWPDYRRQEGCTRPLLTLQPTTKAAKSKTLRAGQLKSR
jgi:hypothetical protein